MARYDAKGKTYNRTRRADPRISARLIELLSLPSQSVVVDIGAGTGNYTLELARAGFRCLAVEPSIEMAHQAALNPYVQWICGCAESMPLSDLSVAACVSVLSYHHFSDRRRALNEMLRLAGKGPLVFFTFCPERLSQFWLYSYFPSMLVNVRSAFSSADVAASEMRAWTGRPVTVHWFPLPHDLIDLFAAAAWRRPELYLDLDVRNGISSFDSVPTEELNSGLSRLEADLNDGTWERNYGKLRNEAVIDLGYLFIRLDPA